MRYLVYLMTLLFVGTAIAQNPTIVQGNYITNVFGNSNFVLNPNAQTNVANVTNATRSTTTPLVATSEFTLSLASGANATWTLRAFDGGMKGQNCEARFTYRGFATATTKAEIVQNSLVVASLTLTPTTDPRIASINFPCGDLANATTFRIAQTTANMTGTNEIGGIYVGLATNMANVAQAEFVGQSGYGTGSVLYFGTSSSTYADLIAEQTLGSGVENQGSASSSTTTAGVTPLQTSIANPKPGNYYVTFSGSLRHDNTAVAGQCAFRLVAVVDGVEVSQGPDQTIIYGSNTGNTELSIGGNVSIAYQLTSTPSTLAFKLKGQLTTGGGVCRARLDSSAAGTGATRMKFTVHRFPSSSELVVTPERQNVWAGVVYTNQTQSLFTGTAEPSAFSSFNNAVWNQPTLLKGKAAVTTTNSGNDLGFSVANLPVGNYKVDITGLLNANTAGSTTAGVLARCTFKLVETTTSTDVARQVHLDHSYSTASDDETRNYVNAFTGVFNNTSVGTRNFRIEAQKTNDSTPSNIGSCQAYSNTGVNDNNSNIAIILTPLDQPSNSALYVEGPVKASATGAAIPAGSVGYELSASSTSDITTSTTEVIYSSLTGASIDVPAGVWLVIGEFFAYPGNATGGAGIINLGQIYNSSDSSAIISRRIHAVPTTTNASSGGGKTITAVVNLTSQKTLILRGAIQKAGGAETITSGGFFPSSQNTIRAIRLN